MQISYLIKPIVITTLYIIQTPFLFPQNNEPDNSIFSLLLEEITEHTEDEELTQRLLEDLAELQKNPLNINKAGIDELRKIFFLTEFQLNSIILYRQEFGNFLSINELQLVPGLQKDVIQKMQLFISISESVMISPVKTRKYVRNDLIIRYKRKIEIPAGFSEDADSLKKFMGNNQYFLARNELTLRSGIKAGVLIEKDAGEPFLSTFNKNRPDHLTAYLELKRKNKPGKFIIGDFKAGYGQGLIAGCSFISKASSAMILPVADGVRKSLSSSESGNLRGLAAEIKTGKMFYSVFFSSVLKDSRLNYLITESDSVSYFTTIYSSGLHRNISENLNRNTLRQTDAGFNIIRNFNKLILGITGVHSSFNHYREIVLYHSYTVPPMYKTSFMNLGIHYRLNLGKLIVFGEWALDYDQHPALLNGILAQPHPLVTLSLVHRKYSPEYISFLSSAFGKSSATANEEGFYLGLNFYPFPFLNLSCYADHYSFPWLRQNISQPTSGNDYYLNATFTLNMENIITIRYKTSCQQKKANRMETGIDLTEKHYSDSWRLCYNYSINESLSLETRYEKTGFRERENNEEGFYLGQKLILKPAEKLFALWLSYGLFDISDWRNRIYIYEHDVLYEYSVPVLYRNGSRFSIMARLNILRHYELWCKYYLSLYDRDIARGSGADLVRSATDSGVKVQLRVKF